MPEMPDYRTEPSPTPEGDAVAVSRRAAWARDNLDPIVEAEPPETGYGFDALAEADRDRMAARVIQESELIAFWLAWHRAGGFAELERGGWDRSTIFRKIRRFRTYYGIHPDNARFPWLDPDWDRCWTSDRLVALNWAWQRTNPTQACGSEQERWQPHWVSTHSDPHNLEARDVFAELAAERGELGPVDTAVQRRRQRVPSRSAE